MPKIAKKDRYFSLPGYFLTLADRKFSGRTQERLIQQIIAHTTHGPCVGLEISDWTPAISFPKWAKLLACSESSVKAIIADAIKRGLIEEIDCGREGSKYRTSGEMWKAAPDYEPLIAKPKPAEPEAEAEQDGSDATQALPPGPRRSVAPGKRASFRFDQPASKLEYVNEVPVPLDVITTLKNGVVNLLVSAPEHIHNALKTLGLGKADRDSTLTPSGAGGSTKTPKDGYSALSPSWAPEERRELWQIWAKKPEVQGIVNADVWSRVCAELGKTPDKFVDSYFEDKLREKRLAGYPVKRMLLVHWAAEAHADWDKFSSAEVAESAAPSADDIEAAEISYLAHLITCAEEFGDESPDLKTASPERLRAARKLAAERRERRDAVTV
jgi:hypothetical protein